LYAPGISEQKVSCLLSFCSWIRFYTPKKYSERWIFQWERQKYFTLHKLWGKECTCIAVKYTSL
jgi:hypothetical protein